MPRTPPPPDRFTTALARLTRRIQTAFGDPEHLAARTEKNPVAWLVGTKYATLLNSAAAATAAHDQLRALVDRFTGDGVDQARHIAEAAKRLVTETERRNYHLNVLTIYLDQHAPAETPSATPAPPAQPPRPTAAPVRPGNTEGR
ncbi:hypothetical protein OK074_5032 [Actinobacteria bacterium OK074]|nr:hypothetical protein OK074_5032 [Actinobacteria bacterium OK074]